MADTGATDQGHASDIRSGVNVIKLFFFVTDAAAKKARVFVHGKLFQAGFKVC
jgi:hypothetical protein